MALQLMALTPEVKERIKDVKRHAEKNIYTLEELKKCVQNGHRMGDEPEFVCEIPIGHKAVYTLEEQYIGLCHHLSVSSPGPSHLPPPPVFATLLKEFGIADSLNDLFARGGGVMFDPDEHNPIAIGAICPVENKTNP